MFGRLWGVRSVPGGFWYEKLWIFGRLFAKIDRFFEDFGPSFVAMGGSKITFLGKNRRKIEKKSIPEGFRKKHEKSMKNGSENH